MDKHGKRKNPGRVTWWLLMAVSGGAVAFIWTVVHTGWALECLRDRPDQDGGHPGLVRVYAAADGTRRVAADEEGAEMLAAAEDGDWQ